MKRRVWFTLAMILAATAVTAGVIRIRAAQWSSVDATKLVARAMSQENENSYVARVTTITGYNGRAAETHATVFRLGKLERIEYAGRRGRAPWSITRDGKTYAYLPKDNALLVTEASRLLSDRDRTSLLLANYDAKCVGVDRIAGRSAYEIELTSRYDDRPGKRLWIDRENRTILRTDDYSASGDKRGSTETDDIIFGARIEPNAFTPPSSKSVQYRSMCTSGESAGVFKGLGFPVTLPAYMPKGYRLEGYHVLYSHCGCNHRSAQLTYTDGLNVISVFQTPRTACCCNMKSGCKCDDQNCGIATLGQVTRSNKTVVVVGDLLPKEVKRIAESVK